MGEWAMLKLTFKSQVILGLVILLLCFLCSTFFHNGLFSNIGGIIYGALFVFHPVYPSHVVAGKKELLYMRLGGVVVIILSLITRFNV